MRREKWLNMLMGAGLYLLDPVRDRLGASLSSSKGSLSPVQSGLRVVRSSSFA